ncbi:hypothetical protein GGF32_000463 [Allomyces javanicus]|nr:hypothetical protein GGF32_000463 [Allomyces javanicus]
MGAFTSRFLADLPVGLTELRLTDIRIGEPKTWAFLMENTIPLLADLPIKDLGLAGFQLSAKAMSVQFLAMITFTLPQLEALDLSNNRDLPPSLVSFLVGALPYLKRLTLPTFTESPVSVVVEQLLQINPRLHVEQEY